MMILMELLRILLRLNELNLLICALAENFTRFSSSTCMQTLVWWESRISWEARDANIAEYDR